MHLQEQARLKALEAEASAKRKVLAGKRDRARQLVDELKNMTAVSDAMREKLKRPTLQVTAPAGYVAAFERHSQAFGWQWLHCAGNVNATAGCALCSHCLTSARTGVNQLVKFSLESDQLGQCYPAGAAG